MLHSVPQPVFDLRPTANEQTRAATQSVWGLSQRKGRLWSMDCFVVCCCLLFISCYGRTTAFSCFSIQTSRESVSLPFVSLNSSWWVWALLLLLLNIKQLVMVNHYYEQRRLLRLRLRLHLRLRLCPHCVARSRTSGHMSVRFIWNKEKETNLMFYSFFSRKSQPKK